VTSAIRASRPTSGVSRWLHSLKVLKQRHPWPTTFGYHEIFHACTAVAALCHYIAMWFVVF
jgi:predicted membrane channel-forming protein YqfA (hemolysin III family)